MGSLLRAIKNLDDATFHQLCFHLLSEKYPEAGIRYVEGAAGDKGLDNFAGSLSQTPAVWQCKAFRVTLIRDPQKAQIRDSLRNAVRNFKPKIWILCLNMDMDTKAHRWFQRLQESYRKLGVLVADPLQATDLEKELIFRRTLRNHYFPEIGLNVPELRALITGTDKLADSALEKLAAESVEQWLDRIRDKDPRFHYEVTFRGERGPEAFFAEDEEGVVASLSDGRKIVKAFVRDREALRLDPVSFQIQFAGTGIKKLEQLIKTGEEQSWQANEVVSLRTTMPLLADISFSSDSGLLIVRSQPDREPLPLRLTFVTPHESATLDYVEFKKTRQGAEEVQIETAKDAPLFLRLVLPWRKSDSTTATVSRHFVGKSVRIVAPAVKALSLVQQGCQLQLFALKVNAKLGEFGVPPLDLGLTPGLCSFLDDLLQMSMRFRKDIIVPNEFTEDDENSFRLLRGFLKNEPVTWNHVTIKVLKSSNNAETLPELLANKGSFRIEHSTATVTLFGSSINIGPCAFQIPDADVDNLEEIVSRFRRATIGEAVAIVLRPQAPVQCMLL